jgi:hypothetical protein
MEMDVLSYKAKFCRMKGKAFVGEHLAAEAIIMCKVFERPHEPGQ